MKNLNNCQFPEICIERTVRLYLDHLTLAEYVKSYKQIAEDVDMLNIAIEVMADYLHQLADN